MSESVRGTFEIQLKSQAALDQAEGAQLGRIRFEKQFSGALSATSFVEMLSARSEVQGSAGYVAIERVTGSLSGRVGSFVLQHSGTMKRGVASLALSVVPDSGTGELKGLMGSLTIEIVEKQHHYTFDYSFEAE